MICAVIDTNVLVSAVLTKHPDTATARVLDYIFNKIIVPIYNDVIIAEYMDVMHRPILHILPEEAKRVISFIQLNGMAANRVTYNADMPDEKDRVFYEVSLSQEDSYLVTGNKKHFPITPKVVSPAEMVAIVETIN